MTNADSDRPLVRVLDSVFRTLMFGTHEQVQDWLSRNPKAPAKMIGIGRDSQIFSVSEYKSIYGNTPVLNRGDLCPKDCSTELREEEGTEGTPYLYCWKCGFNTL